MKHYPLLSFHRNSFLNLQHWILSTEIYLCYNDNRKSGEIDWG